MGRSSGTARHGPARTGRRFGSAFGPALHQDAHDTEYLCQPRAAAGRKSLRLEPDQTLLGLRRTKNGVGSAHRDHRDESARRVDQRAPEPLERRLLQRAANQERARLPAPADGVLGTRVRLHHPRGVWPLSAPDARLPLAPVADHALSERVAARQRLLPDRTRPARRQPRPADQRRPAIVRHHHAVADARPAVHGRHAGVVHHDPVVAGRRADHLARRHAARRFPATWCGPRRCTRWSVR